MKYRCEVDVSFTKEEDYIAFLNLIQDIKGKIYVGTKDDTIATVATMRHYECTHDDAVPRPCGLATPYNYIDLKKKEKEVFKMKDGKDVSMDGFLKDVI